MPAVMPTYARVDIAFERGDGAYLYTSDGRRFLDFGTGIAVTTLGHAHPRLVAALTEQEHAGRRREAGRRGPQIRLRGMIRERL